MPIDGYDLDREVVWWLAHAGTAAPCRVLDLGCGDGRFVRCLAQSFGYDGPRDGGIGVWRPLSGGGGG